MPRYTRPSADARRAAWLSLGVVAALGACSRGGAPSEPSEPTPEHVAASPAASQPLAPVEPPEPAPSGRVGIPADSAGRLLAPDAAPVPAEPLRLDQPAPADTLPQRDLPGLSMEAELRWLDVPGPPRAPEVNLGGIEQARRATALRMKIDLAAAGRMRVEIASRAFPFSQGTELRARADRFGTVLVWPDGDRYRSLPPGSVRTLLGERRLDVVPVVRPQLASLGDGAPRLGLSIRRQELATRTGKLTMERAKVETAGAGATLLCRLLAELVAVDPQLAPCTDGDLPLRAQYAWSSGGGLVFEATSLSGKLELPIGAMLAPPPAASYAGGAVPPEAPGVLLTREEMAAFRTRALEPTPDAGASPGAPGEGLVAANGTDLLRYLLIDGVPVAWAMPGRETYVIGAPRGRYTAQWRSFLGDAIEPARTVELPARLAVGQGDARPDPGRDH